MLSLVSTSEAKSRFSEVIRQVRNGRTVRVSWRGKPVAEIRPIPEAPPSVEERQAELERRGVLVPAANPVGRFAPIARAPGALQRFLDDRGE